MEKLTGGKFSDATWVRIIAVFSMGLAWVISTLLFPALTENSDEGAYLSQADALTHWQLTPTAYRPAAAFQTWFGFLRDGQIVYKYPPVYPAALALAKVLTGTERSLGIVLSGMFVLLVSRLARKLNFGSRTQLVAAAIVALSPLMLIQNATFLPYVFSSVLLVGFGVLLTTPEPQTKRVLFAGVIGSLAFWARPFDAVLFCGPIALWTLSGIRKGKTGTKEPAKLVAETVGLLGLGAVPGITGFLLYNRAVTGSAFKLPFNLLDKADTIGFGLRRIQGTDPYLDFTVSRGWLALIRNAGLLTSWSFGGLVLVALGCALKRDTKEESRKGLLFVLLAVWPVGFFFFWGSYSYLYQWDGASFLGPYYYLPMLAPLAILGGFGLEQLLIRSRRGGALAAVLSVLVSLPIGVHAFRTNVDRTRNRKVVADAIKQSVPAKNSLLLVPPVWGPHLQHPFSFLRNDAVTSGKLLSALSGNLGSVSEAIRLHPGRSLYRLTLPAGHESGGEESTIAVVDRVSLKEGNPITVCFDAPKRLPLRGLLLTVTNADQNIVMPFASSGVASIRFRASGGALFVEVDGMSQRTLSFPIQSNNSELKFEMKIRGRTQDLRRERELNFSLPVGVGLSRLAMLWPPVESPRGTEFEAMRLSVNC
jgi:hypothetical protein